MGDFGASRFRDVAILVARILLVTLFLIFGWQKLTGYGGTVEHFAQINVPVPPVSAIVSIVMECFVSLAILLGVWTRPLAALFALYTLGTGLLGHQYWTMTGTAQVGNMINFYKNVSIMGGFLLLYATGAGKYSVDARIGSD